MAQDEGAEQTALIMRKVKDYRLKKRWSAARLAEEMTNAGVPWDRSVVTNLELGRRKSLRVHELLALAYVLDVNSPIELLVPEGESRESEYPVTPTVSVPADIVNRWCYPGSVFTLGEWLDMSPEDRADEEKHRRLRFVTEIQKIAEVIRAEDPERYSFLTENPKRAKGKGD